MEFILQKIRKYPVSSMYIMAIWVICLMDVPETPLNEIRFIDKWTHIAMYLGTCLTIWGEYYRSHRGCFRKTNGKREAISWAKLIVWAWLMPVLMGGAVELAQAYCTGGRRSGEWMDFFANATGCTLALIIGTIWFNLNSSRTQVNE